MIDTDLYVLPVVAHYLLDIPQGEGRAQAFLSTVASLNNSNIGVSYRDLLARNAIYNLNRAEPFASNPSVQNLLHLRPGQPVGNWRDSNEGLGYGTIPFDVNVALVPSSLRALARLVDANILVLDGISDAALRAQQYAQVWEQRAAEFFSVEVKGEVVHARWKDYIIRSGLDDGLLDLRDTADPEDVTFYALSLHDNGSKVDVSTLCYKLTSVNTFHIMHT